MASSSQSLSGAPSSSSSSVSVHPKLKSRQFTKIPVFIVENHNDVLELLLPSLANRYLPFKDNVMIHFDSHPDLCVPRQMPAELIFDRRQLLESLSIENWIVPMWYSQHVKEVAWIRPPWAHQIPDGHHHFSVGEFKGKIHVSSPLDYFLSDGGYKDEKYLSNSKSVSLHVTEIDDSLNELIRDEPDSHWILDIDLDYFSTLNPFRDIYPKANTYEKLRKIFMVEKTYDAASPESVTEYADERNHLLDFFETVFQHMAQCGSLEKFKCEDEKMKEKLELAKELIDCLCHHYSIYDIDWFIVNDAGCTCDEEALEIPHHESTEAEIRSMVGRLEKFLKCLKKPPTLITIARSSNDGYTPAHQVDDIQSQVLQVLRNVYAENLGTETLFYKNPGSDVSALEMVEPRKTRTKAISSEIETTHAVD